MTLLVPDDCFNVKLRWRLANDNEEMICTLGVTPMIEPERSAREVAEAVSNAWLGAFAPATQQHSYTFVGTSAYRGGPDGATDVADWDVTKPGTGSGNTVPQNCALLVRKKTELAGQSNTGRMYVPPTIIDDTGVDDAGFIHPAVIIDVQDQLNQFWQNLRDEAPAAGEVTAGLKPVLFHSKADRIPTPIISFTLDSRLATQRQRLRR